MRITIKNTFHNSYADFIAKDNFVPFKRIRKALCHGQRDCTCDHYEVVGHSYFVDCGPKPKYEKGFRIV